MRIPRVANCLIPSTAKVGQNVFGSKHVILNALNSTSSPRFRASSYSRRQEREKGEKKSSNVQLEPKLRN